MTKNTPRIFISLLLMLLCIGILPVSAFASGGDYPDDAPPAAESSAADAQEAKQIGTVTTNGGNLNVRTGAGLDNTAFTQLPNGTVVDVIGSPAEADAIVSDLTDQRSLLLGSKMERAKRIAWNELLFRAHEAGANGILAIRYDVYMLPKGLFGASVTGTAVAIEQLSQLNQALSQDLFGATVTGTAVKVERA